MKLHPWQAAVEESQVDMDAALMNILIARSPRVRPISPAFAEATLGYLGTLLAIQAGDDYDAMPDYEKEALRDAMYAAHSVVISHVVDGHSRADGLGWQERRMKKLRVCACRRMCTCGGTREY
jgi:hypothetical protein